MNMLYSSAIILITLSKDWTLIVSCSFHHRALNLRVLDTPLTGDPVPAQLHTSWLFRDPRTRRMH